MRSVIALDKIKIECVETDKAKPTVNVSGFITYSKTIKFSGEWLDNSGHIVTQWGKNVK